MLKSGSLIPPDYSLECFKLTINLIITIVFWLMILPYFVSSSRSSNRLSSSSSSSSNINDESSKNNDKSSAKSSSKPIINKSNIEKDTEQEINFFVNVMATIGCMISIVYLLMTCSPYNYYISRGVFQIPILNETECATILKAAHHAALQNFQNAVSWESSSSSSQGEEINENFENNNIIYNKTYQALLEEPIGWRKARHDSYPTTDLNLVTDAFTSQDRAYIQQIFDTRVAPTLSRIYGIPIQAIRANDVRKDMDREMGQINQEFCLCVYAC